MKKLKIYTVEWDFIRAYNLRQAKSIYCNEFDYTFVEIDYAKLWEPTSDWLYHYLEDWDTPATMTKEEFEEHLKTLSKTWVWL